MNYALRHCGLPSLSLWETLLPQFKSIICHEDNTAMIRICQTGRNPTMRYLSRTMGISIAWLYERFQGTNLELIYEESAKMAADIFTKAFTDKVKWQEVCNLVNIVDKDEFYEHIAYALPPAAGGGTLLLIATERLRRQTTRSATSRTTKYLTIKLMTRSRSRK